MPGLKNVVLVHGAWADASSWSKIIPLLQAKGLHVACVQNPLTSIVDDVAATRRIVNAQDGPVLLVGHSYGGAVITVAGNHAKVAGLVYVAAFAPDEGETLASLAKPYGATPLFGELQPIEDGFLLLTAKGVTETFAQDLSPEEKKSRRDAGEAAGGRRLHHQRCRIRSGNSSNSPMKASMPCDSRSAITYCPWSGTAGI